MLRYVAMPMALGLCLSTAAAADTLLTTFDGVYRGRMELQNALKSATGIQESGEVPPCETHRPAEASITAGYITIQYLDWHRHLIHFRGQVTADGAVKAYHLNSNGQYSPLTGHISNNRLEAGTLRGRCYYGFALTKR
jgi:hypothetical protein